MIGVVLGDRSTDAARRANSMMLPGMDTRELERLLSEMMGRPLQLVGAVELGASSRATPWRIDVDLGGEQAAYLLRYGESTNPNEVAALHAMSDHPIPTPQVLYWDETGAALGTPIFVSEFVDGTPLLPSMTAGEAWAIDLYIDTVCTLQAIRVEDLAHGSAQQLIAGESIHEVIESAYTRFSDPGPLHEAAYQKLIKSQPVLPEPAFSNGDLWPENLLVKDRRLIGVVDWQHAGWSDPVFEFLLPFFLVPELRDRGIEETYLERQGYESSLLHWYHGVEYFDSLSFVLKTGGRYEMHTAESLSLDLEHWLNTD